MQQINEQLHVKVSCRDEIRRFLLPSTSYNELVFIIKNLYSLDPTCHLDITFQDDEGDWVTFDADDQFAYAVQLCSSPFKIKANVREQPLSKSEQPATDVITTENSGVMEWEFANRGRGGFGQHSGHGHGHGHRGRGRGGRGGCQGRGRGKMTAEEIVEAKTLRITQRMETLQAKINSGDIPKDRIRVLTWRLMKLEEKLSGIQTPEQASWKSNDEKPLPEWKLKFREIKAEKNEVQQLLKTAHQNRDNEAIQLHQQTLKELRQQLQQLRQDNCDPVLKEKFIQSKADLKEARLSGDDERIKACHQAVKEARREFKK